MLANHRVIFTLISFFIGTFCGCQNVTSNYVVQKDLINVLKAGQFSILDQSGQHTQYRIQSRFSLWQTLELVAQPSNQILAKLKSQWNILLYEAVISILDPASHEWIDGKIRKHLVFFGDRYTIEWNGKTVTMETNFASLTTEFRYQNQGTLLATFRKRWISLIWSNTYDLERHNDSIPDSIYFLALAAKDYNDSYRYGRSRSSKRKMN